MARRGVIRATASPSMLSVAAVEVIEAEEQAREFGAARTHQAEQAEDFALPQAET